MDKELKTLIEEASEYLDEEGRTSFDNANKVETLIGLILENLNFSRHKYGISEEAYERAIRSIIGQIDSEENIESTFQDLIGELKKELGTSDKKNYSVVFPLSIEFSDKDSLQEFEIHGAKIEQLTQEAWEEEFLNTARQDGMFEIQFTQSPYEPPEEGSFWKTHISAIDPDYAIERATFMLRTYLGEVNYINYYNRLVNIQTPVSNPWPQGWSKIVMPFILLVFNEDEFVTFKFSEDARPRGEVEVSHEVVEEVKSLPEFGSDGYEIDNQLISGLHFFLDGMTNVDRTGSFLDFWRGLETLTLSEPGDSSSDIIERATILVKPDDEPLFKKQVDRIVDSRNDLVHGNTDVDIQQSDLNTLKELQEALINLYFSKRGGWGRSKIKFTLHKCSIGEEEKLKQQKEARILNKEKLEDEIEVLEELLKWTE